MFLNLSNKFKNINDIEENYTEAHLTVDAKLENLSANSFLNSPFETNDFGTICNMHAYYSTYYSAGCFFQGLVQCRNYTCNEEYSFNCSSLSEHPGD